MVDTKACLYTFFLCFDKTLREKFLGKFSINNYGEDEILDGYDLHAFYELTYADDELYVKGNVPSLKKVEAFDFSRLVVSLKTIPPDLRRLASELCHSKREIDSLSCQDVETIISSHFGKIPFLVRDYNIPCSFDKEGSSLEFSTLPDNIDELLSLIPSIKP
ncbi:MAG: hypothetical protein RL557_250 [archaeon]|jgi:hypothetical protein